MVSTLPRSTPSRDLSKPLGAGASFGGAWPCARADKSRTLDAVSMVVQRFIMMTSRKSEKGRRETPTNFVFRGQRGSRHPPRPVRESLAIDGVARRCNAAHRWRTLAWLCLRYSGSAWYWIGAGVHELAPREVLGRLSKTTSAAQMPWHRFWDRA